MGACHFHMTNPVKLFVFPGILMLLNDPIYIIIHRTAGDDSRLAPPIHGQLIQIVARFLFYHKGFVLNPGIQKLPGLLVHLLIVSAHLISKLSFRPVNIQERKRVIFHRFTGFFSVVHVIGQRRHFTGCRFLRPDAEKWFYCCHNPSSPKIRGTAVPLFLKPYPI